MVIEMNGSATSDNSMKADYCIEIDYKKNSENPSRVFRSMSDLIESFQRIDKQLVNIIDVNIQPVLLLEDVEAGSIKAWLRAAIKRIPDDALTNWTGNRLSDSISLGQSGISSIGRMEERQ